MSRDFGRHCHTPKYFVVALFLLGAGMMRPAHADEATDLALLSATQVPANALSLEDLDLDNMTSGYNFPRAGKSLDGAPLKLRGVTYPRGVGTYAESHFIIDLKGAATRFVSAVGLDDEVGNSGTANFVITVDGKEAAQSGPLKGGEPVKVLSVDLRGARRLVLDVRAVDNNNTNSHADWAGAMLLLLPNAAAKPVSLPPDTSSGAVPFPPFFPAPKTPLIHGPRVIGASPNRPFLFRIPATGQAPLSYAATNLPAGLTLNARSGIISGRMHSAGDYAVALTVSNALGRVSRSLKVLCGPNTLAQTPPMGWNAWNIFGESVTAALVREQADWLIKSGLAARGFSYIVIDDTWQGRRDEDGNLRPNARFGDMKALADAIHAKGLKLGLYSSPNPETCAGFAGSADHEEQDARAYASWGIDYLKYDWCLAGSNRNNTSSEVMKAAYAKMRAALDKTGRDIILAITPYGIGDAWNWAPQIGVNSWGTGTTLLDRWENIRDAGFALSDLARYAKPGAWNDPGWLMVGKFGTGNLRFSRLTPAEQMTQVSLWSLSAAPLMLSCDLRQLDPNTFFPFATALLTNSEVLDIDQDSLGQAATRLSGDNDREIWSRPLWDGTRAVGLFNKADTLRSITVNWKDVGLNGPQPARDLWRHLDFPATESFAIEVPAHGVALLKVGHPAA